jgi:hypothetical protein
MHAMTDADINFLARQSERIMSEIASLRDDAAVLTSIVLRLDGSMAAGCRKCGRPTRKLRG